LYGAPKEAAAYKLHPKINSQMEQVPLNNSNLSVFLHADLLNNTCHTGDQNPGGGK
jgi:hypothetical protein